MTQPSAPDTGYVSGRFLEDLLRSLSRTRIDVASLLDGLDIDRQGLRSGHPLIEWDVFVEILCRLESQAGGAAELQRLGEEVANLKPAAILRRLAGWSASPAALYRAAAGWALRRAIPLLRSDVARLEGGRVCVTVTIPAPHRPSPALLHLAAGALRGAPRILGLPDAIVSADVQPSRAVFTVLPPSSGTVGARIRRAFRALFSARAAYDQLEIQQGELQTHFVELRAAYAVLEESEARHRILSEAAVDIVSEIGRDGQIQYASPSLERLTGFRPDEVIGRVFTEWVHPDDMRVVTDELEALFRDGRVARSVFRLQTKSEGWRWFEIEANTYRASDDDPRAVAVVRDVNDRMELESERERSREILEREVARRTEQLERRNRELRELQALLLQAERLGIAQDLAGQVAHSIRNPLGALIGHIQLALRDGGSNAERLGRALDLACRVRDVTTRTLELYREGKVNLAPLSAAHVLDEVANDLEGRVVLSSVNLRLDVQEGLPELQADPALLGSALVAIAENAIQAMEGGGDLKLSARRASGGEAIEFRVTDNGPGIPAETRERIFDPFFTTKAEGTGLGLAIARGVVQGHDGELDVQDRPGGGTIVAVTIPTQPRGESPS